MIRCPERVREYVLGTASCDSVDYDSVSQFPATGPKWANPWLVPPSSSDGEEGAPKAPGGTAVSSSGSVAATSTGLLVPFSPSDDALMPNTNNGDLLRDASEDNNQLPGGATNDAANTEEAVADSSTGVAGKNISECPDSQTTPGCRSYTAVQLLVAPNLREGLVSSIVLAQRVMKGRGFINSRFQHISRNAMLFKGEELMRIDNRYSRTEDA